MPYNWLPACCAPTKFPVKIISGRLITADNQVISIPAKAFLANGWGRTSEINLIGTDENFLPDRLIIKWFSFRERKFYEIDHTLPRRTIEHLFEQGFVNQITAIRETYEYIIFGLAPKGSVSVWLNGYGLTKEVTIISGKELQLDPKWIMGSSPDLETYIRMILNEKFTEQEIVSIAYDNIDLNKWLDIYRSLRDWQLHIITSAKIKYVIPNFYNGETKFWSHLAHQAHVNLQPVPKSMIITCETREGNIAVNEILFNETEIFAAFARLSISPSKIIIQIEINTANNSLEIYLLNHKNSIRLKNSNIEIY